jgi:hypothetical protein
MIASGMFIQSVSGNLFHLNKWRVSQFNVSPVRLLVLKSAFCGLKQFA